MSNKKERFFKKAFKTLPRLQKDELVRLSKTLITERAFLVQLIENNSKGVVAYQNGNLIFRSPQMTILLQEFPNFALTPNHTGLVVLYDIMNQERMLDIEYKLLDDELELYYVSDLSAFQEKEFDKKNDEGLSSLENMAANIAHEIKNPLSAIDIHTQLIQRKIDKKQLSVSEEIRNYLSIVKIESKRLLEILNKFLNKIRKVKPDLVFLEVADIISQTISVFQGEFQHRKIECVVEMNQVPKIFTDPLLLQQIISDLIRNAIEAVEIVKPKKLRVSLNEDLSKKYLIISVEDSGEGIKNEMKRKVFTPYFTTKKNGTGLGLTLIKKMLNELGGSIVLKDATLGGASFQVFLPISQTQNQLPYIDL